MAPAVMNMNTNTNTNTNMNDPKSLIIRRAKFGQLLKLSEPYEFHPLRNEDDDDNHDNNRNSSASEFSTTTTTTTSSGSNSPRFSFYNDHDNHNNHHNSSSNNNSSYDYSSSPMGSSPWSHPSPLIKSPWNWVNLNLTPLSPPTSPHRMSTSSKIYFSRGRNCLIGSLIREDGHVYSLAVKSGTLYAGSESKNIRVWSNFKDSGGFKSGSGLVKAIVISGKTNRVFTGHQDGKIRIWTKKGNRVGTLPKLTDYLKSSVNPKNYVEVRRHHKVPKIKHFDAISCLSLNEELGLLYSGSWDKTIKVWRMSDGKCLESIEAHDDAINSIVVGFDGLVFSGSADGSVKVWRRELEGRSAKHFNVKTLLEQENAVTSLAVGEDVLYCGSSDGLVNFWEWEKDELRYGGVLRGHKLAVLCLATAGSLVLSGSADKTICVWKRERGGGGVHSCLAVLSGHCGPVKCLAVEPDLDVGDGVNSSSESEEEEEGRRRWIVYSGSLDKSVRIWRVSEHAPEESV